MANQELKDLVETLGTGIGSGFDIRRLRYGRIVLLMDADSDGYHISTLLLAFFFRHMIDLVRQGKIYLAQPPLYRITVGTQVHYAQDDAHKEEITSSLAANRKYEVTRFKGLGEISPKEFGQFINGDIRLVKVGVRSLATVPETLGFYMGKNTPDRRDYIMEHLI